jgi:hypothetical protein
MNSSRKTDYLWIPPNRRADRIALSEWARISNAVTVVLKSQDYIPEVALRSLRFRETVMHACVSTMHHENESFSAGQDALCLPGCLAGSDRQSFVGSGFS